MQTFNAISLACIATLYAASQTQAASSSPCLNSTGSYISGKDCFPDKSTVTVAQNFNLTYHKTFKVFHVPSATDRQYTVLYQRGTTEPTVQEAGIPSSMSEQTQFIAIPVTKVAVQDTTSLTFFEVSSRRLSCEHRRVSPNVVTMATSAIGWPLWLITFWYPRPDPKDSCQSFNAQCMSMYYCLEVHICIRMWSIKVAIQLHWFP